MGVLKGLSSAAERGRAANPLRNRAAVLRERSCFRRGVGQTTLYRHAGRNLKWAGLGFFVGFALLVWAFASSLVLGFAGFLVMLACAFIFERNLRKMGKAGWDQVTGNLRAGNLKDSWATSARGCASASSATSSSLTPR